MLTHGAEMVDEVIFLTHYEAVLLMSSEISPKVRKRKDGLVNCVC